MSEADLKGCRDMETISPLKLYDVQEQFCLLFLTSQQSSPPSLSEASERKSSVPFKCQTDAPRGGTLQAHEGRENSPGKLL